MNQRENPIRIDNTKDTFGTVPEMWGYFAGISAIPRPSNKEERVRKWLAGWADSRGYQHQSDDVGNISIRVPGCGADGEIPTTAQDPIILQAHMDMVCEKRPGHAHDFDKDPIKYYADGDWIKADGTTLGADNGIGVAIAMALCAPEVKPRPPLELLFTVDEETGMTGAVKLGAGMITGKNLINIDSEDDDTLIIGCAGGQSLFIEHQFDTKNVSAIKDSGGNGKYIFAKLTLSGFRGGHSGVDIPQPVGNAIRSMAGLLAGVLRGIESETGGAETAVVEIGAGTVHNAIPREATAVLAYPAGLHKKIEALAESAAEKLRHTHQDGPSVPQITLQECSEKPSGTSACVDGKSAADILQVISTLPNGVISWFEEPTIPLVSGNAATIALREGKLQLLISLRSLESAPLREFSSELIEKIKSAGMQVHSADSYPPWPPRHDSPLQRIAVESYAQALNEKLKVSVIHAGLEPAVFRGSYPDIDMVSCGPLILNPHSPDERLSIQSSERVYNFLKRLLQNWQTQADTQGGAGQAWSGT